MFGVQSVKFLFLLGIVLFTASCLDLEPDSAVNFIGEPLWRFSLSVIKTSKFPHVQKLDPLRIAGNPRSKTSFMSRENRLCTFQPAAGQLARSLGFGDGGMRIRRTPFPLSFFLSKASQPEPRKYGTSKLTLISNRSFVLVFSSASDGKPGDQFHFQWDFGTGNHSKLSSIR